MSSNMVSKLRDTVVEAKEAGKGGAKLDSVTLAVVRKSQELIETCCRPKKKTVRKHRDMATVIGMIPDEMLDHSSNSDGRDFTVAATPPSALYRDSDLFPSRGSNLGSRQVSFDTLPPSTSSANGGTICCVRYVDGIRKRMMSWIYFPFKIILAIKNGLVLKLFLFLY